MRGLIYILIGYFIVVSPPIHEAAHGLGCLVVGGAPEIGLFKTSCVVSEGVNLERYYSAPYILTVVYLLIALLGLLLPLNPEYQALLRMSSGNNSTDLNRTPMFREN